MNTNRESLKRIFSGFIKISKTEQTAYLDYLDLVIERRVDVYEKNRLMRFKKRLEKEMKISSRGLKSLEKRHIQRSY